MCPGQQICNLLKGVRETSRELCFLVSVLFNCLFFFLLDSDENRCSWNSSEARPALVGVYTAYGIRKWFSIGFQWFMCVYLLFRELCQILVTLIEMWILTALGFAFSQGSCYAMSENTSLLPSSLCITDNSLFLCYVIGKMAVMSTSYFSISYLTATALKCGHLCIAHACSEAALCYNHFSGACKDSSECLRPWLHTRSGVWLWTWEFHVLEIFLLVLSGIIEYLTLFTFFLTETWAAGTSGCSV